MPRWERLLESRNPVTGATLPKFGASAIREGNSGTPNPFPSCAADPPIFNGGSLHVAAAQEVRAELTTRKLMQTNLRRTDMSLRGVLGGRKLGRLPQRRTILLFLLIPAPGSPVSVTMRSNSIAAVPVFLLAVRSVAAMI